MKILFLTQIVPFPPNAGPRVKTWHLLRYLASRGHQITLACFVREEETRHLDAVRALGIEVISVPIRRSLRANLAYGTRSYLANTPFLTERDNLPEMRRLVSRLLAERRFDIFHADQFTMAQFAPRERANGSPARIFDAHNANWSVIERARQEARPWVKPLLAIEQHRLKRYEGRIVRSFEHTLTVTEIDRRLLLQAVADVDPGAVAQADARMVTIPIAVDTQALPPAPRVEGPLRILTLGTLHYAPNADGIRWFLEQVFPRVRQQIPDAQFTIIGKNPPEDFLRRAREQPEVVRVTGYVDDLSPYFADATLMVVPVRVGGGMRVRILEAFARAMPLVTTSIGLEGIDAQPERDVLIGDTAEDFAAQVVRLASDPALQSTLAQNSRRLAECKYDWQVVLASLDKIYAG